MFHILCQLLIHSSQILILGISHFTEKWPFHTVMKIPFSPLIVVSLTCKSKSGLEWTAVYTPTLFSGLQEILHNPKFQVSDSIHGSFHIFIFAHVNRSTGQRLFYYSYIILLEGLVCLDSILSYMSRQGSHKGS